MPDQSPLPPLTINPQALSLEHHLLRALDLTIPMTRAEAIRRVVEEFPGFARLGTPEQPSPRAQETWRSLIVAGWCRYVNWGRRHGQVLTGLGERRLRELRHQQIALPYLESIRTSHGDDVARQVAATLETDHEQV